MNIEQKYFFGKSTFISFIFTPLDNASLFQRKDSREENEEEKEEEDRKEKHMKGNRRKENG
jgi:hypothetical protein